MFSNIARGGGCYDVDVDVSFAEWRSLLCRGRLQLANERREPRTSHLLRLVVDISQQQHS